MRPFTRCLAVALAVAAVMITAVPFSSAQPAGPAGAASAAPAAERTVVTVPFKGPAQIEDLRARGIEIIAFTKYGMDVLADDRQLDYLMTRNYPVTVTPQPERAPAPLQADLGGYTTYDEMKTWIGSWMLNPAYDDLLEVFSLGSSIEGRIVYGFKISDNVTVDEDEPEVLYIANHHAREIMTVDIVMMFADSLLTGYGNDALVTDYVDNREIYFVPMMNPDGHYYVEQNNGGSSNYWWRKNRRDNGDGSFGVDLNRNWGYEWGYDNIGSSPSTGSEVYRGTGPFSEPETQAVRNFCNQREITMWLSYHSYGELLLYPWGYYNGVTPDHDVFVALGELFTASNGYSPGTGYSLYAVNGDSDDWGYGEQGTKNKIFAFTPEINSAAQGGFGPDDSLIRPTFDLLLEMNFLVLEYADNPYRVLGPQTPLQYAISEPSGSGPVHRLSWSSGDPADPNPPTGYDVEMCESPARVTDDGTMPSLWTIDGFTTAGGYTGDGYYSGAADNLDHSLTTPQPLVAEPGDTLTFWINYDIETNWDYGYVEVSTNGGGIWTSIPGNITTTSNPNGTNLGHGITGQSGGWVTAQFPLGSYAGQDILYRIRYVTDGGVVNPGFTVDDITPVPSCNEVAIIASAIPDTTYDVDPDTATTFRYRVRAIDADGQTSRWSNTRDYEVTTLTAADGTRGYRTGLGSNYPNPFNPSTRIPFVVGEDAAGGATAAVQLRIYSVTGALVATLVDERRAPGTYESVWNGTNDAGQPLASGIYFAQLVVASGNPLTRKLVLLK